MCFSFSAPGFSHAYDVSYSFIRYFFSSRITSRRQLYWKNLRRLQERKTGYNAKTTLSRHPSEPRTKSTSPTTDHVTVLILFIGYPRSGHTLISSLLDAHPHVAVANEYCLARRWRNFTTEQKTRKYVFGELFRDSVMQSEVGYRSATVQRTFNYSIPNQWNGRFDNYLQVSILIQGLCDPPHVSDHLNICRLWEINTVQ